VAVSGLSGVTAISASGVNHSATGNISAHACALVGNVAIRCWGDTENGAVWNGTITV
jgi:hypothetical protein